MRLLTLFLAGSLGLFVPSSSRADDKQVCAEAYKQAQTLRDDHKLLRARDQLRVCGRAECPAFIAKDCTSWLAQVDASTPSVVFSAKDATGADLVDVKVSMDDAVIATTLEGRSVEVDPGPHAFTFEAKDGTKLVQQAVVREGVKEQQIAVSFAKGSQGAAANGEVTTTAPTPPSEPPDAAKASPLRTLGFVAAGLGVVGIGIGSVFGVIAISKNNSANCDASDVCVDPQARRDAQSAATPSTIGFIAGGVLLAGGIVMVLAAPSEKKAASVRWEAAPLIARGTGGLSLRGTW